MSYRVLFISCQFPPEIQGGADTQCLRQAKALTKRGHKVTILTSRARLETLPHENLEGITIRRFYTAFPPDLLGRWVLFSLLWTEQCFFYALRHRNSFDIVHCHQGKFGTFIGAMIAWICNVPEVVKIGNGDAYMDLRALQEKKIFGPIFLWLGLLKKPTFVAISRAIADNLREFGIPEPQIVSIANAIERVEPSYKSPTGTIQLFWHGRIEVIKNLPLLVEGFALAYGKNPNLHLHIIGDGTQKKRVQELVKTYGITGAVNFVPPTSDIFSVIREFDVFVNTSLAEGMSNSMLEALQLGKLVVSTQVSGTAEIIDEGAGGFIIPDYTPESVAETILKAAYYYAANHDQVYRHNIRKAEECFSMESIIANYEALYKKLLA